MRVPSPSPHLGNDKLPGNKQRPQQVVSAVISQFIDGYLKTKRIFEGDLHFSEAAQTCFSLVEGHVFTCEPVRMTGLPRFSHMKDRAEAVYAIVSVPWRITNPS